LVAGANRQEGHFFGDHEMRHAPDQDEDEAYFAADDDAGDDGISELSRILEGDRALLPPQSGSSFMSSSGDVRPLSSPRVPLLSSNSDVPNPRKGRELVASRRLSPRSSSSPTGSLSGGTGLEANVEADDSSPRATSGNALVSNYAMAADEDNAMGFDEAMANSTWTSRGGSRNRGALVDYPFDCEAGDMFATDSTNDTAHITTGRRAQSPFGPGRGSITLKWEYGDFKETIRGSPKAGSNSGNSRGKCDGDDGNVVLSNEPIASGDAEGNESGGRREKAESNSCRGQDGEGRHDPVLSADSGDITTSPKKRRRTNGSPSSLARSGLETSTRWVLSGGGQHSTEIRSGGEDASNGTKECALQDDEELAGGESNHLGSVSADSGRPREGRSPLRALSPYRRRASDSDEEGT
jgi:hypothetical protein